MTVFRETSAAAAVLAALSILLAPPPAAADHDTQQQQPPQSPPPTSQVPPPAQFTPDGSSGFYYLLDFDFGDAANPKTDADFDVDLDWSVGLGFGAGYRIADVVRLEAEFHSNYYRAGSLDLGVSPPFAPADYSGGEWAQGLMANLLFDLPAAGSVRPYLGAGYGFSRVSVKYNEAVCFIFCFSTTNQVVNDWDFARAWQAMAGVTLSDGTNTEMYFGYRYFETEDLDFHTVGGTAFVQDGLQDHTLTFGMRFKL